RCSFRCGRHLSPAARGPGTRSHRRSGCSRPTADWRHHRHRSDYTADIAACSTSAATARSYFAANVNRVSSLRCRCGRNTMGHRCGTEWFQALLSHVSPGRGGGRYGLDGACIGLAVAQIALVGLLHLYGYEANAFAEFQLVMLILSATWLTV